MFLEFINSREVHHCRIQVPVFPFQGKKSWHLPTKYILTSNLHNENGVEILVDTDFSAFILVKVR
jgi:hypothetical protein